MSRTRRLRRPAALLGALALAACGAPERSGGASGIFREERTGMEFVQVRGGAYSRGTDARQATKSERPAHAVQVSDFWIARGEVTVGQFRRFAEATGYRTEVEKRGGALEIDAAMRDWVLRPGISWRNPGFAQDDAHPVVWVTWNDAAAFALWLAGAGGRPFRLPTEAEWEYAAREGGRDHPWSGTGRQDELGRYAWYAANSGGVTHPGASREPNALGIHDMSGNVWEWCGDWFVDYTAAAQPLDNPAGPTEGRFKALRGGSWRVDATVTRTTYRNGYRPDYAHSSIGFRVAFPAAAPPPASVP